MKHYLTLLLLAAATLTACEQVDVRPQPGNRGAGAPVAIEPIITRATETDFESGDAIGLTVSRAEGAYATNEKLTFDGKAFTGTLVWYAEGADEASLTAYYPYQESGVPTAFSVSADQRGGITSSDLMAASKTGVVPSESAVAMVFTHRLSRLCIKVQNNSGAAIDAVTVGGVVLSTGLAADMTATTPSGTAASVKAWKAAEKTWYAIVPPQTAALSVAVESSLHLPVQYLAEATLQAGKQYSVGIVVNKDGLKVTLSGAIDNWEDGGELQPGEDPGDSFVEHLDQNYFTYGGRDYKVAKLKDGKWWMAENLAVLPDGMTPAANLEAVSAGVFYPIRVKADQSGAEFTSDEADIAANGYLYQAEVALGLKMGDITSEAQAKALEATQGLCPKGWHVPTLTDIQGLVGKVAGETTVTSAPYYNGSEGSMALLNADGFGMKAFGAISIIDVTKTTGTFMGYMASYKDHLCTGMFIGSTFASISYLSGTDASSGIRNVQFYGLMPMTNKASESDYTCNGTKVSFRIAAPLRCVRDE